MAGKRVGESGQRHVAKEIEYWSVETKRYREKSEKYGIGALSDETADDGGPVKTIKKIHRMLATKFYFRIPYNERHGRIYDGRRTRKTHFGQDPDWAVREFLKNKKIIIERF